jgi:catechol 2,3-dioxygenase-like lactoylglutathione lyase family enzyme
MGATEDAASRRPARLGGSRLRFERVHSAILAIRLSSAVLAEIALFTADVDATVAFYARVLSREPASIWSGGATFDLDGVTLLIHALGQQAEGMPPNVDHVAFRVTDLESDAERLGTEAADFPWGRSAYLRDPDGRLVELQ